MSDKLTLKKGNNFACIGTNDGMSEEGVQDDLVAPILRCALHHRIDIVRIDHKSVLASGMARPDHERNGTAHTPGQ